MTYIPPIVRRQVGERAQHLCEYCRFPELVSIFPHEVDHVVATKHKGETTFENLALSCFHCNRHKGSDLTSIDDQTGDIIPLYNPRKDVWSEHFRLKDASIEGITAQGRVTVELLHFNDPDQVSQRAALITVGRYS